jgi:hypothetical protein
MTEIKKWKGQWFLPSDSENEVKGTLSYNPEEGLQLELIGTFRNSLIDSGIHEIIHGRTGDGDFVVLLRNFETSYTYSDIPMSSYKASQMIIGEYSYDHKADNISFFTLELDTFSLWKDDTTIVRTMHADRKIEISLEESGRIKSYIGEGKSVRMTSIGTFPRPFERNEFQFKIQTNLELFYNKNAEFAVMLRDMNWIKKFFDFASNYQSSIISITFNTSISAKFCMYFSQKVKMSHRPSYVPLLFKFSDVKKSWDRKLCSWFDKRKELYDIVNQLPLNWYTDNPIEEDFLSISRAAELLHTRGDYDNIELPKEEHRKRIECILSSVSENHKAWLQKKLEYSNIVSLRARILDLINNCPESLVELFKFDNELPKHVTQTRHCLTHYSKNNCKKAKKGKDLVVIMEKLRLVVTIQILKAIGFQDTDIVHIFNQKSQAYQMRIGRFPS